MILYLVRHGETYENAAGIAQGHYDAQLNANGCAQAQKVARRLAELDFDAVFSSDLSRAYDTAQLIASHHTPCELITTEQLRERTHGIFDNCSKAQIKKEHNLQTREDYYEFVHNAPGAETDEELYARAQQVINELLVPTGYDTVCVTTHRNMLVYLISCLQETPCEQVDKLLRFGNTSVSAFAHQDDHREQMIWNDTTHISA